MANEITVDEIKQMIQEYISAKYDRLETWQMRANCRGSTYRERVEAKVMCDEIQRELDDWKELLQQIRTR